MRGRRKRQGGRRKRQVGRRKRQGVRRKRQVGRRKRHYIYNYHRGGASATACTTPKG